MLNAARRAKSCQSLVRSRLSATLNQSVTPSINSAHLSINQSLQYRQFTETSEESAKRLSDEADAEFRASGKKANLRTKRPAEQTSTQSTEQSTTESTSQTAESTTQSTSQSTEQPTGQSSSQGVKNRKSLFTSLTNEWGHFQQFMSKFRNPVREKSKRDVAAVLSNENPFVPVEKDPLADMKKKEQEEEEALNKPFEEYTGPSDLVMVDSSTVWDKRLERMRDSFASSKAFITFRKAKRTLIHSDNPILKPIQNISNSVSETIDDIKLTWETSQHPALFKVRNVTDKVMGENEQGYALGELHKVDPSFDLLDFMDEMEHYMIPAVVTAYLRGSPRDAKMLKGCSEGRAASSFWSSLRARDTMSVQWDSTILDLSGVELQNVLMDHNEPRLLVSFLVQQVKCVRKLKGYNEATFKAVQEELQKKTGVIPPPSAAASKSSDPDVVEGDPSQIVSTYYVMVLRRDFENPDFDWKITEFSSQEMHHLAA